MSDNASHAPNTAGKSIASTIDETGGKVTVLIKQAVDGNTPEWTDAHRKHLATIEPQMYAKWVADNAEATDERTRALIRKAFKYAFNCGAGTNHALRERGV